MDPILKNSQSELDTYMKYSPVGIWKVKKIMCIDHHEGTENLEMLSLEDATGEWNQVYSTICDIQNKNISTLYTMNEE
jgi:hypothetical protein